MIGIAGLLGRLAQGGAPPGPTLLDADFTSLADGGTAAAAFASAYPGLAFARSTGSTVQTSASAIVSGLAADVVAVGSDGGPRGLVVQNNTWNRVGTVGGNDAPRNAASAQWTAGSGVTITTDYANGPDGAASADRCVVSSAGYGSYTDAASLISDVCFSTWQRSTATDDMQQGCNNATPNAVPSRASVRAASTTWGRLWSPPYLSSRYFGAVECRDSSNVEVGGQTARARDVVVDFQQGEYGDVPTEAIPTGKTARTADRITLNPVEDQIHGGALRLNFKLAPKHDSNERPGYGTSSAEGIATYWYLWRFDANNYARIIADTRRVEVCIGGTTSTTTWGVCWARNDVVDVYVSAGGSVPTVVAYRRNGGSWIDLAPSGGPFGSLAFTGTLALLHDGSAGATGDAGVGAWRVQRITAYDAARTLGEVAPTDISDLTLTGLWIGGNYNAATPSWTGSASAGTSFGKNLGDSSYAGAYKPAVGPTRNGYGTVDMSAGGGYFTWLETSTAASNFVDANAATFIVWQYLQNTTSSSTTSYANSMPLGVTGDYAGIYVSKQSGAGKAYAFAYDGGFQSREVAQPFGRWSCVQYTIYGGQLRMRVNRGAWTRVACGNITNLTNRIALASLGAGSPKSLTQALIVARGLTEAECDQVCDWIEAKYGAPL